MLNGLYHNVTYLEVDMVALFGVSYYVSIFAYFAHLAL